MKVWNKRDPNVPENAVYVGRPTKWGNPFVIGHNGQTRQDVIKAYKLWLCTDKPWLYEEAKAELKGKDLVCWCAPEACHADILMEIANS